MNIREHLQNSVISVVVSIVIATIVLTFGAMDYFHSQQMEINNKRYSNDLKIQKDAYETKIKELNKTLASIKRKLSTDDCFDIRSLFVDSRSDIISEDMKFFSNDLFYAPYYPERFKYSNTTAIKLNEEIMGKKSAYIEMLYGNRSSLVAQAEIHLWKGGPVKKVQGNVPIKQTFPYIAVQREAYDSIRQSIAESKPNFDDSPFLEILTKECGNKCSDSNTYFSKKIEKNFYFDTIGSILTGRMALNSILTMSYPDIYVQLVDIQKVKNVLYLVILWQLKNITVDNVEGITLFVNQELFFISTRDSIYTVVINLPSDNPTPKEKYAAYVNEWLNKFSIYYE